MAVDVFPGLSLCFAPTLGSETKVEPTLKALGVCDINPYRVESMAVDVFPGLSLCSNPGLQLANAFGVTWIKKLLLDLSRELQAFAPLPYNSQFLKGNKQCSNN